MSRPNLVFSLKGSDSVMGAKFQIIWMRYSQLPNHQRYHRRSPLRLYSWNLGDCLKALICAVGKVRFFINGDWFCDFCKVSSNFVKICKLSKIQANKRKWQNVRVIGQLWEPHCTLSRVDQFYFSHQKGVIRLWVQSFKSLRCDIVSSQITKDTTDESPEGLYSWNRGDCVKALTCVIGNQK